MQSRRDQVEAQSYMTQRLAGALVSAEPDSVENPTRRDLRGFAASVMVGLLACGGVALYALLSSSGSTAWQAANTLIVNKTDGSRYLMIDGLLRPVENLASARLAVGGAVTTASVKSSTLQDVPRGEPIGIQGAPDSLPTTTGLATGIWRVCATTPSANYATAPTVGVVTDIGSEPSTDRFTDDEGLLVTAPGRSTTLLWQGQALPLGEPWVADVLGWGNVTPLRVPTAWLDLIPAGPTLGPSPVPGAGGPGPEIDGQRARIGDFFATGTTVDSTYYVLQRNGLSALNRTQYLLGSGDSGRPTRTISAAGLAAAQKTSPANSSGLPSVPPAVNRESSGSAPCVEQSAAGTDQVDLVRAPLPAGAHVGNGSTQENVSEPTQAVRVVPGAGRLVGLSLAEDGSNPSYLLVNDSGTAYPLADEDVIKALGYDATQAVGVPRSFIGLLRPGTLLSTAGLR
ncbi:type VII secretion protein EccB [Kineosporia succinea]|uniref:Type VII secretion protein EccB n=1 Tax=Kineosporia succinea TaxID=84632 RepID=A0ABT9P501_9ACTN|nr:type VII secretion protein EccB [Kineosporia succinea]MDP9827771.1 type VII secretion protein EccB [Kineosporia succinea]